MFEKIKYLVKDGFFHILGGNFLIKVIGFISSICIVRLISKEDYGYLTYTDNLYSYVAIFTGLGMASGILVRCSKDNYENKNWSYFRFAVKYGAIFQVVISLFVLIYFFVFNNKFPKASMFVIMLFLYQPLAYILQCVANFVRSYQANKLYSGAALLQSVVLFVCSIVFTLIFGKIGIVIGRYMGIAAFILLVISFIKNKRREINVELDKDDIKGFMKVSVSLLIASFFSEIMYSNELFLVGYVKGNEDIIAEYKIATLIPSQIMFVTQSLLVYFIPKFVELKREKERLWKYSIKTAVANGAIVSFICIMFIIINPYVIMILYGKQYMDVVTLSNNFWIAYSLNALLRMIPLNVLATTGYEKYNAYFSVIGAAVHFIITMLVLKYIDINYLPVAVGMVYLLIGTASWICLKRAVGKIREYDSHGEI